MVKTLNVLGGLEAMALRCAYLPRVFEDLCSKLQGSSTVRNAYHFIIRSLIPQPAKHCRQAEPTGNALAIAVQEGKYLSIICPNFSGRMGLEI